MSTIELKIIGHGYNTGGERSAEERLAALQKDITDIFGPLQVAPDSMVGALKLAVDNALDASKLSEDSSQGASEVEWILLIDHDERDDVASLRTVLTAPLASGPRVRLDASNAEVSPDKVRPITITAP